MVSNYSPFEKPLKAIDSSDLVRLFDVAEGWYVEYKREVPNAAAIAKSISALANTYGGWVFYGVSEKSKDESVAGDLNGVPIAEVDAMLQRIRQACATSLNPTPHYEIRAVKTGIVDAEGVESGPVICVHVPKSYVTPHVHKDGRIYRRVADGSEPKAESDRFILDQLWGRGKKIKKEYRKWERDDPHFSKAEAETPYLRVLVTPHGWDYKDFDGLPDLAEVRRIFIDDSEKRHVPFDTLFESASGYVVRQCNGVSPHDLSITWKITNKMESDIVLPLYLIDKNSAKEKEAMAFYRYAADFFSELNKARYHQSKILDLNLVFLAIKTIVSIQRQLLAAVGLERKFEIKIRLLNCWRTIPFFDTDFALQNIQNNGIPILLKSVVSSPDGSGPDSFWKVDDVTDVTDVTDSLGDFDIEMFKGLVQSVGAFIPLAKAFGLPNLSELQKTSDENFFDKIQAAATRGLEVQRARNSYKY